VTDVDWKVANYFRKFVPAGAAPCEPTRVPGAFAQESGRLVYGPSASQGYDTQVWRPEKGWPGAAPKVRYGDFQFGSEMIGKSLEQQLGGIIPFFTRSDKDSTGSAVVSSSVQIIDRFTFRYTYTVSVKAADPVQLQWGVVKDPADILDELKDFYLSSKTPMKLGKERTVKFVVTSPSPPKWGLGSVVIRDAKGGIVARGTASSYGPVTGSIADPE
jgi:hypothetical protein